MDGGCLGSHCVMYVRSACPLSLAFCYCFYLDSSSLQWERRDWHVSWDWSCQWIQSLVMWYHTACCRTMNFSISHVLACINLHWVMRLQMCWDSTCIPSPRTCLTLESSSSQWAQKCSSDFIVILMASRVALGVVMVSFIMVLLSIKVWRACLSLPSNMSLSCFHPYGSQQHGQSQCPGYPGSHRPWCRRLSSPQTG